MTNATTVPGLSAPADATGFIDLIAAVRRVLAQRADWTRTACLIADHLRADLPDVDVLSRGQRRGRQDRPVGHLLHSEADGSFSVLGVVWRPGQSHIYGTDIGRIGSSARRYYD